MYHHNKKHYGMALAAVGLGMAAAGFCLVMKAKKEEDNGCCHDHHEHH